VTDWSTLEDDGAGKRGRDAAGRERRASRKNGRLGNEKGFAAQGLSSFEARLLALLRHRCWATAWFRRNSFVCGTPPRELRGYHRFDKIDSKWPWENPTPRLNSPTPASFLRRGGKIRENIIGRSVSVLAGGLGCRVGLVGGWGAIPVLDQPTRQHSCGIFFHPRFQQLRDFLAQIGGVRQSRQLIALQRVTGSGEEKLPRGLRAIAGQRVL
jgi:hypothetical protein